MNGMQQKVYFPPNVAGWEGGLSGSTPTRSGALRPDRHAPAAALLELLQRRRDRRQLRQGHRPARQPQRDDRRGLGRQGTGDAQRPVDLGGDQGGDRDLRRHADHRDGDRGAAPATALRTASADSRRPRRTGDVTCAVSDAKRSSWRGSVTPLAADAADPVRGARRVPRRPLAVAPDAATPDAVGGRGLRVRLRRQGTRLGVGVGVGRAGRGRARANSLVLLYLAGGNDGLNIVMPNGNGDELAAANYAAYSNARKDIGRGVGPTVAGGKVGSWALPGQGDARRLAFTNAAISTAGGGDNADAAYGFDTLYGDGMGGTGSNLAVMPAVDALKFSLSHFDNSDIWFEASYDLNNKTGWLGRWIDEYGKPDNPLQAISIDSALSKSIRTSVNPVCAISSLPVNGFKLNGANAAAAGRRTSTRRSTRSRAWRRGRATPTWIAPARPTGWPTARPPRSTLRGAAGQHGGLPEREHALRPPAHRRLPAQEPPGHADHHDPLGRLRHPHQPDHVPGLAVQGALARARRLPEGPPEPRHRPSRLAAGVLGVRAPREGDPEHVVDRQRRRYRSRRGRPDVRSRQGRQGRSRVRVAGLPSLRPRAVEPDDRAQCPGQPEGHDRLPFGLSERDHGVAGRPEGHCEAPAGAHDDGTRSATWCEATA